MELEIIFDFTGDSTFFSVLDWVRDQNAKFLSGDAMFLQKKDGGIMISYDDHDEIEREKLIKKGVFVKMKKDCFIDMVNQWNTKFINMKNKPEEITFTLHDNGQVTIDTKD